MKGTAGVRAILSARVVRNLRGGRSGTISGGREAVSFRPLGAGRGVHLLANLPLLSKTDDARKPRLLPDSCALPGEGESSTMAQRRAASLHHLWSWSTPPTTMLLIQKPDDPRTTEAMGLVLRHMSAQYPHVRLIVEPHTAKDHPEFTDLIIAQPGDEHLLPMHTSIVLTLGGDGTLLHVSNLFSSGECPPVLSFSMGSLGFLLPFHIDALGPVLENALHGPVYLLNRMRLACNPIAADNQPIPCSQRVGEAGLQVMNEVTLHRGRSPHLTVVDAFFEGQHLTEAVADGLLLSTPTGSTAYSLSAGGPISHPDTDAFLLTPIAPRSLSFRTVILPAHGEVKLEISPLARGPVELSVDGREVCLLKHTESVVIRKSEYPIPCIERMDGPGGWARDINSLLQFNVGFRNKSLLPHQV